MPASVVNHDTCRTVRKGVNAPTRNNINALKWRRWSTIWTKRGPAQGNEWWCASIVRKAL